MKRSLYLVTKETILTYIVLRALIISVAVGSIILLDGIGNTKASELIVIIIMSIIIIPTVWALITILVSPKGVIKIDVVDGNLEVIFESHNFLFKRGTQRMVIENGSTYEMLSRPGQYETKCILQSGEDSIMWSVNSADFLLRRRLQEYFTSLGTEITEKTYLFTNDITLEPESKLRRRNIIRKLINAAVIIVILFGIGYWVSVTNYW